MTVDFMSSVVGSPMCVCVWERWGEGKEGGGKGRKGEERRERGGEHAYTNGVVTVVSKLW